MTVVDITSWGKDGRLDGSCFAVRTYRTRRAVLGLSNFPQDVVPWATISIARTSTKRRTSPPVGAHERLPPWAAGLR